MSTGSGRGFVVGALIGGFGLVTGVFLGATLNPGASAPVTVDDASVNSKIDNLTRSVESLARRSTSPLVADTTPPRETSTTDVEPKPLPLPDTTSDRLLHAIELLTERIDSLSAAGTPMLRHTELGGGLGEPAPINTERVLELLELGDDAARVRVTLNSYSQIYRALGAPTVVHAFESSTHWIYVVDARDWRSLTIMFTDGLATRVTFQKRR